MQGGPLPVINGATAPFKEGYNLSYSFIRPFIDVFSLHLHLVYPPTLCGWPLCCLAGFFFESPNSPVTWRLDPGWFLGSTISSFLCSQPYGAPTSYLLFMDFLKDTKQIKMWNKKISLAKNYLLGKQNSCFRSLIALTCFHPPVSGVRFCPERWMLRSVTLARVLWSSLPPRSRPTKGAWDKDGSVPRIRTCGPHGIVFVFSRDSWGS